MTYQQPNPIVRVFSRLVFIALVVAIVVFFTFPLYWIVVTSIKPRGEVTQTPPAFIPFAQFQPTLNNYVDVIRGTRASPLTQDIVPSPFPRILLNSLLIGGSSTLVAVLLGTLAAYAFSRIRVPAENDLMFFILSTRMLPPIVVVIPIFVMFSNLGLRNSFIGLHVLYVTMGLPFVVWMMKGFFDKIPKEYEEAAMLDGCSRLGALVKVIVPQSIPALLATTVFVLITVWNEFVFSQLLNPDQFSTVPPYLYSLIGFGRVEWARMAAAAVIFLAPIVIFTVVVRNHLLNGLTFGAVRK